MDAICTDDHIGIADGTIGKSQPRSGWRFIDSNTAMSESDRSFHRTKQHLEELDAVDLIAQHRGRTRRDRLSP
jgi:hypothetical protein